MRWNHLFRTKILSRGEEYALDEKVNIIYKSDKLIEAKVKGTIDYNVEIDIDDDEIKDTSCDCLYFRSNGNCKHLAATLYTVYGFEDYDTSEYINTEKLLDSASYEDLVKFLRKELNENLDLFNRFRVFKGSIDEIYYKEKFIDDLYYKEDTNDFINNDLEFLIDMKEYNTVLKLLKILFDDLYYKYEKGIVEYDDDFLIYDFESLIIRLAELYSKDKVLEFLNSLPKSKSNTMCDTVKNLISKIE